MRGTAGDGGVGAVCLLEAGTATSGQVAMTGVASDWDTSWDSGVRDVDKNPGEEEAVCARAMFEGRVL